MLDNVIIEQIRAVIIAGLTAREIDNVAVKQNYQPTQQGIDLTPTIYIDKLFDHPYGSPAIKDEWDADDEKMIHTETQVYETTFQVNALSIQVPTDDDDNDPGFTASDLVKLAFRILESDVGRYALRKAGLGLQRITQIRNPKFKDDRDQYEAVPSFDFVLSYSDTEVTESDVINTTVINIKRV